VETPAAHAEPEGRSLKEQVAELAAQGLSPDAIAARLKVSVSEVDLIIAIGGPAE
jgi:DNA-binding CsgD family transcriptional regulator